MTDRRLLIGCIIFVVMAASLAGYYWLHKPIRIGDAQALASAAADVGIAAWLTALAGALGRRVIAGWGESEPGERVALQAGLGFGLLGLGLLGLGLVGGLYSLALWLLFPALSLVLWPALRGWLADVGESLRAFWPASAGARWAALLVGGLLTLGLLRALAPPLKWDALVYHLTLPKLYAQAHNVFLDVDIMFSGMPQMSEMLYTAAVLLRGPAAAQTLGWVFGALLALGLAGHARRLLSAPLAPLPVALLLSSFSIALALSWAYVELLLMLMAVALLVTLRQWQLTGERRWLILGGLLSGFAMGGKYTGAILPLAAAGYLMWVAFDSRAAGRAAPLAGVKPAFVLLLVAFAAFVPWLVKNLLITGNPVYPLLFVAGDMDRLRLYFYNRPDLADRNPLWAGLIIFRAVFLGVQGNSYDATLNPFLVLLPAVLALGWRQLAADLRRELAPLAVFGLAGYGGWVALVIASSIAQQARLFYGLFPALAVLAAGGLAALRALDTRALRISFVAQVALAVVFALSAVEYALDFTRHSPLAYLAGQQSADEYRRNNLGWYAVAMERLNALPPGSRVIFLWEVRSLECKPEIVCLPDVILDRWWHLRRTLGAPEAVLAHWQAQGVTHVLVYDLGLQFERAQPHNLFQPADWAALELLRAGLRPVEDIGATYHLYQMPP